MTNLLDTIKTAEKANTNSYLVEIEFEDMILGTQPKSSDIMQKWLEGKHVSEELREAQASRMSSDENIDEEELGKWTGFFQDELGLWIGTYQLKAALREIMVSIGLTKSKTGSKQTMQHLIDVWGCGNNGGRLRGEQSGRLHLLYKGEYVTEAHELVQKTAHVMTAQGPRSVIKQHDGVRGGLVFLIVAPANLHPSRRKAVVTDEDLADVLVHAQGNGLGCSRSQGFGKFRVVRFEKLTDVPYLRGEKGGKKADGGSAGKKGVREQNAAK